MDVVDRNVLAMVLNEWLDESTRPDVVDTDAYVDQMLDVLQHEEPALLQLLQENLDVARLQMVTNAAIRHEIIDDHARQISLQITSRTIAALMARAIFAIALAAVRGERARQLDERGAKK